MERAGADKSDSNRAGFRQGLSGFYDAGRAVVERHENTARKLAPNELFVRFERVQQVFSKIVNVPPEGRQSYLVRRDRQIAGADNTL
jgi:hypothetical protein